MENTPALLISRKRDLQDETRVRGYDIRVSKICHDFLSQPPLAGNVNKIQFHDGSLANEQGPARIAAAPGKNAEQYEKIDQQIAAIRDHVEQCSLASGILTEGYLRLASSGSGEWNPDSIGNNADINNERAKNCAHQIVSLILPKLSVIPPQEMADKFTKVNLERKQIPLMDTQFANNLVPGFDLDYVAGDLPRGQQKYLKQRREFLLSVEVYVLQEMFKWLEKNSLPVPAIYIDRIGFEDRPFTLDKAIKDALIMPVTMIRFQHQHAEQRGTEAAQPSFKVRLRLDYN